MKKVSVFMLFLLSTLYAQDSVNPMGDSLNVSEVQSEQVKEISKDSRKTLAVMDFEAGGVDASLAKNVTEKLRYHVSKLNDFRLMNRSDMSAIMNEMQLSQSGACSSTECYIEMGQLLGVQIMLLGNVGKVGNIYTLTARLIDVETSELLKVFSIEQNNVEKLFTENTAEIANNIENFFQMQKFASISISSSINGANVYIDGALKGSTPIIEQMILPGKYKFKVTKDKYKDVEFVATVNKGKIFKKDINFEYTEETKNEIAKAKKDSVINAGMKAIENRDMDKLTSINSLMLKEYPKDENINKTFLHYIGLYSNLSEMDKLMDSKEYSLAEDKKNIIDSTYSDLSENSWYKEVYLKYDTYRSEKRGSRIFKQVTLGILSLASGGFGYYSDVLVRDKIEQRQQKIDNYNSSSDQNAFNNYADLIKDDDAWIEDFKLYRTIGYSAAGAFAAASLVLFAF